MVVFRTQDQSDIRVSVLTENRSNGLKIFRMIYESEFMD